MKIIVEGRLRETGQFVRPSFPSPTNLKLLFFRNEEKARAREFFRA